MAYATPRCAKRLVERGKREGCVDANDDALFPINGDGTLTSAGATRSLDGVITQVAGGGTGSYTVADLVPPDRGCVGALKFLPSGHPQFDLFIPLDGQEIWMIQTDPGNVFQGRVTKVAH